MQELYTPDYYLIDEMFLGQIVFEKDINITDVTLFAYYYNPFSDALEKVEYYCNFETLLTILALADEKTDTVTRIISERIMDDFYREYPCVIDIEGLFSYPLKIGGIIFTIYKPKAQNEKGEWQEDDEEFYIIDEVKRKNNGNCKTV